MNTGQKIAKLRSDSGWSQPQLAEKLNVGTSTVGMWETNKRNPSYDDLIKIAEIFSVSTDYLLGNTDIKKNVTNNNDEIELDDGIDGYKPMSYRGKQIPDADKEILKRILKGLE